MSAPKFIVIALAGLTALAMGIWAARAFYTPDSNQTDMSANLWAMQMPDPNGKTQSLSQWRGKLVVINYWATWCAPCREEIPDLVAIRREYGPKNVEIVGIAIDNADSVKAYMQTMGITYPVLIGEGQALSMARAMGNPTGGLPYSVVISQEGKILMRHLGRLSKLKLQPILNQAMHSRRYLPNSNK